MPAVFNYLYKFAPEPAALASNLPYEVSKCV